MNEPRVGIILEILCGIDRGIGQSG